MVYCVLGAGSLALSKRKVPVSKGSAKFKHVANMRTGTCSQIQGYCHAIAKTSPHLTMFAASRPVRGIEWSGADHLLHRRCVRFLKYVGHRQSLRPAAICASSTIDRNGGVIVSRTPRGLSAGNTGYCSLLVDLDWVDCDEYWHSTIRASSFRWPRQHQTRSVTDCF